MAPIDVLAQEIRAAYEDEPNGPVSYTLATRVAKALTDDTVVDNAVAALAAEGWDFGGIDRETIARVVLGSVGGR